MDSDMASGRTPHTVECHLANDLVDTIAPGDVIDLTAVVK